MNLAEAKPTTDVSLATAISAAVGLLALLAAGLTGTEIPPEVVAGISTLVVGVLAIVRKSAKVTAGVMATAAVVVLVWALGEAGAEIPGDGVALLTTLMLFVFSWITSEASGSAS